MPNEWSDTELSAAVDAYRRMQRLEAERRPYSKRAIYRELAEQFSRTEKSFEFRMQNISAVLARLKEDWIPGLKPADNVGANVEAQLISMLNASKRTRRSPPAEAPYKSKLGPMRQWLIEVAKAKGKVTYGDMMNAFGVDRFSLRHAMDFLGHQSENLEEPILTALIVGKKTQRCSAGLEKEFGVLDDEVERTKLYAHWSQPSSERFEEDPAPGESLDVKAARFASTQARPEQAAFRYRVSQPAADDAW